jgi:3'-phosphoadenosine 5'-phosphosulfate sulfotransferase (PAPS reductase)/FAD synthetase
LPALKDLLLEIDTGEIDIELTGFEMPEIEELMTQFFEEDPTLGRKKVEYQSEFSIEQELIEEIKKRKVFFTFSGGKDSSLTAFLMIPILREIKKDFELLFVDTGVELPGVAEYVVRFAGAFDAPLKILKSEKDFFQYYEKKKSFPSPFYRDCIGLFINSVVDKYIFANLEKEEEFLIIRGGREKQTLQKSKGEKFYKLQEGKREVCILNPLFDLAEEAFQKKLDQLREVFGLWEGYDMGFQRTACWCCPFQTKAQYEAIQKHLPLCWNILKRKALEWEIQPESTLYRMAKD